MNSVCVKCHVKNVESDAPHIFIAHDALRNYQLDGSKTDLDFNKVDRLHQPGLSSQHGCVKDSPCGGNDLTTTSMDGISVQGYVVDVEPNGPQVFITNYSLLCSPLETSHNTVLIFVEVLYSFGAVDHKVGTIGVWAETPNLPSFRDIVVVLVSQVSSSGLEIVPRVDFSILDVFC